MNRAVIIGNLTRDPELRTTRETGLSVCSFTVAVSRRMANQSGERPADFIPVVAWRGTAENCAKYLQKGSQVAVAGAIQTRNYEDDMGARRYVTEIIADEVKFIGRIREAQGSKANKDWKSEAEYLEAQGRQEVDDDFPF